LRGQLLSVSSNCQKSSCLCGGCVSGKKVAGGLKNVVASRDTSSSALDLGVRIFGASDSEVGAEAFASVSGEIAEGLSAFVDAGVEINEALNWQTTAGLKWRF
tara:strand:- start:3384 stop:3692 length:309 start_codon:yes stop_codon:yes gene_type:complete